jgi:hypothetical protein
LSLEKIVVDGRLDGKIVAIHSHDMKRAPAIKDALCQSSILPAPLQPIPLFLYWKHTLIFQADINEDSN